MDLEEDLPQEFLLNVYDASPTSTKILYNILLDALQSRDFRSFKNAIEQNLKKQPPTLDINYVFPNGSEETCLDIASRNGLTEFVKLLLRNGARPNRVNEAHNRAPIHFATEDGHVDTLEALLAEPTINPNLEAGQQTALHIAVKKRDFECAGLLLKKGASASIPNSKGMTALHLAAKKSQVDMVKLILDNCQQSPDLDSYRDYSYKTTREVIQQIMPDLPLPPKCENREANAHDLKYYLIANDEANFLKNLELVRVEILHDVAEDLLEMAAQRNFHETVCGILEKLREKLTPFSVRKAAHTAVQQGHHAILRELLNVEPKVANDLILNACLELGMPGKRGVDNTPDRLECLKLILEQKNVDVRCTDNKGNTPLHYAARAGCREAVTLLLDRGSYIGHMNKFNVPPVADIPTCTLSRYFDDCLQMRKERTNEYTIEFNYRCLMPHNVLPEHDDACRSMREMDVFKYIARNSGLKCLLKHPLLSSFLYFKWYRIRHLLLANFLFYLTFYILLNAYILSATYDGPASENGNGTQASNNSFGALGSSLRIAWYEDSVLWAFTIVLLLLFALRELLQFVSSPWHYLKDLGNWLEAALIVLTFALLCGAGPQVAAVAILLSAWELVILISQHPRMSTGIEMFRTVSFNFARFLFPYAFLILAFALAFYTLFKDGDDASFPDPGRSIFKTIIMLTGEFDASDIPFVSHPVWSHIVFVLFVFLIAIVLFNLLNGLAVSDTAEILCKAELVGLISRIRMVSYIEDIAVGKPFRPCCGNSCSIRWNPFGFLARKILLFPHYLRDGRISVKPYDCPDAYDNDRRYDSYVRNESVNRDKRWTTLDPKIIKQAKQIICEKNQLSDNEKIIIVLKKMQEKLETMEVTLNTVKLAVENNNINNTVGSVIEN
ncbi:transient receptor potential cation channel protein painless isoform X2 [Linepithema humile]